MWSLYWRCNLCVGHEETPRVDSEHTNENSIMYMKHSLFDILQDTHLNIRKGEQMCIFKELPRKYANVIQEVVISCLSLYNQFPNTMTNKSDIL